MRFLLSAHPGVTLGPGTASAGPAEKQRLRRDVLQNRHRNATVSLTNSPDVLR